MEDQILAPTVVLSHPVETSRLGDLLRAIKEREQAPEVMGVDSFEGTHDALLSDPRAQRAYLGASADPRS